VYIFTSGLFLMKRSAPPLKKRGDEYLRRLFVHHESLYTWVEALKDIGKILVRSRKIPVFNQSVVVLRQT